MRLSSIELGILSLLEANRRARNNHRMAMLGTRDYALQHAVVRLNPGRQTGKTLAALRLSEREDAILVAADAYPFLSGSEYGAGCMSTPCKTNDYRWVRSYSRIWIDEPSRVFNGSYSLEDFIADTFIGTQTYIILGE